MARIPQTMFLPRRLIPVIAGWGIHVAVAMAAPQDCLQRPPPNSTVENPPAIVASHGLLKTSLTMRTQEMMEFPLKVCYVGEIDSRAVEAPTLRLNPGDDLDLSLTDHMTYVRPGTPVPPSSPAPHDPCAGGNTGSTSTNLDFDGLQIPTSCHQGESSATTIENADPAFRYQFRIADDQPPGLDWYHPHLNGSTTVQINGGASGVVIVGGIEKQKPEVAGLPERVLVFRQQLAEDESDIWPPDDYRFSLNFQTISPADAQWPVIRMKPGKREFWRVANACAQGFLALQLVYGDVAQPMDVIAMDGIPLGRDRSTTNIELPPGGRAEFIVAGPAAGQDARLLQTQFDTGRTGFRNPPQQLAKIVATPDAQEPPTLGSAAAPSAEHANLHAPPPMAGDRLVSRTRHLYLAEAANGTNGPTRFFLTVDGQTPAPFDPSGPPAVTARVGTVEDWIVANHSGDVHAFHMHHLHFLLLEANGEKLANPEWRDTVTVPAWNGVGPYPAIRLRVDFRDPRTAGVFEIQDQIAHVAEAGMMALVRVTP